MARPTRLTALAEIPDAIWVPVAAGALLLLVGLLGVVAGQPWLLPSLGPSAVLSAANPAHPTSRAWNTVVGHAGGLIAGFVAVLLFGASTAPSVLVDHQLVWVRVAAAVVAIILTLVIGSATRSMHPPAAATTLLVALGSIATLEGAADLLIGVVILAIAGELLRRARLERVTPSERMAPRGGATTTVLHR